MNEIKVEYPGPRAFANFIRIIDDIVIVQVYGLSLGMLALVVLQQMVTAMAYSFRRLSIAS